MKQLKYFFIFALFTSMLSCIMDDTPPVFSVTPVEMTSVDSVYVFGEEIVPGKINPAFEYYVNSPDVQVRACSGGYVIEIFLNENFPDYEIMIKPSINSAWLIVYDHVRNLNVTEGQYVNPADVLGTVGVGERTELQINDISAGDGNDLSYCPFDFGTADFIQQHTNFTEDWCLTNTVVP